MRFGDKTYSRLNFFEIAASRHIEFDPTGNGAENRTL